MPDILASMWPSADARGTFAAALRARFRWPCPPLLTPSGRAALYHACRLFEQPVAYLPAYTCWVALEAVRLAGKRVVFVDVEPGSLCMDLDELSRAIREPGIIVATHPFGYPERMRDIMSLARRRGCAVVEDCAGALGTMIDGQPAGLVGDAAIFSLERHKLLTLGMGGVLLVRDDGLRGMAAKRIVGETCGEQPFPLLKLAGNRIITHPCLYGPLLRVHFAFGGKPTEGMSHPSDTLTSAYCRQMRKAQCRLGTRLVAGIERLIQHRHMLVDLYDRGIDALPGMRRLQAQPGCQPCPIRYPIFVHPSRKMPLYREMLRRGVDLGFSFSYVLEEGFPQAASIAASCLNLPIHAGVDRATAGGIIASLSEAWRTLETAS